MFGYANISSNLTNLYQYNQNLITQNQQLQQENVFYQTCINYQMEQLSRLKTKRKEETPLAEINQNNVNSKQPRRSLKRFFDLGHAEKARRNRDMKKKFTDVVSTLTDDIVSVKVEIEFDNGHKKYSYQSHQKLKIILKLDTRKSWTIVVLYSKCSW